MANLKQQLNQYRIVSFVPVTPFLRNENPLHERKHNMIFFISIKCKSFFILLFLVTFTTRWTMINILFYLSTTSIQIAWQICTAESFRLQSTTIDNRFISYFMRRFTIKLLLHVCIYYSYSYTIPTMFGFMCSVFSVHHCLYSTKCVVNLQNVTGRDWIGCIFFIFYLLTIITDYQRAVCRLLIWSLVVNINNIMKIMMTIIRFIADSNLHHVCSFHHYINLFVC